MKRTRRFISILLAVCLIVGLTPTAVLAVDEGKAMYYRALQMEGGQSDIVYYGMYPQSAYTPTSTPASPVEGEVYTDTDGTQYVYLSSNYYKLEPIAWRTLENHSSERRLLLISDQIIDAQPYNSGSTTWENSSLRSWLDETFKTTAFSAAEQGSIKRTDNENNPNPDYNNTDGGVDTENYLYLLSIDEARNTAYFQDDNSRAASMTSYVDARGLNSAYWWLRSPGRFNSYAAGVDPSGSVNSSGYDVYFIYGVRPVFNLNLNSVLFTSAAEGGKSSGAEGADALKTVSTYDGNEWKVTVRDSSRNFSASINTYNRQDNSVTFDYTNATVGDNEYVSAIIRDSEDNITYYGRLKNIKNAEDANGTLQVSLPDDFNGNSDTLYIFSEQCNGDKQTDYASSYSAMVCYLDLRLTNITCQNSPGNYLPVGGTSDCAITLVATGDYVLPESITVTIGGNTLTPGEDTYTYNSSTGELVIKNAAITGSIIIEAQADLADISTPTVTAQVGTDNYTSSTWTDSNVTFTISGSSAPSGIDKYQYSTDGGTNWTDMAISEGSAVLEVTSESTTADGTKYIFRAVSKSGTAGAQSSEVVVKIDKSNPTIEVTGKTDDYLQSNKVTISASDTLSGVSKVEVSANGGQDWTEVTDYANGYEVKANGTYTFRVTDGVGKTATDSITYTNIDTQKPVVEITATAGEAAYTDGAWTNKDITLSVSNSTVNLGDTKFEYKVGDGEWQTYSGAITVSEETSGTTYTFRATSEAGVVSTEVSITVRLDKTAPGSVTVGTQTDTFREFLNTITFGLFFKDTQTVTISAADTGSGVKEISYQLSGGEVQTTTADEHGQITFRVEPQFVGNISNVTVTDNAGNSTSATEYEYFAVDAETPAVPTISTGSYTSGQWTNGDVTITVSGATADSGIAKYQYSTDNGANWNDMTASKATEATATTPSNVEEAQMTISDSTTADGTTYIFRAVSGSGVEGTASSSVVVKIDKAEPAIEVSGNTADYLTADTVTITPTVGVSGIASITVSKDNGEPETISANGDGTYTYTITENGTYAFVLTNGAGVTATSSITYDKLDQTKPVVSLDTHGYTSDEWTNGDVTLSVSDTSAALGDTKLEYKVGDGEWQEYTDTITVSNETDGTVYSFRAISASGVESETVSVTVKIDKTAPDGDITIEENSVKKFIHDVTFGLFFKENVDVAITGTDDGSGVQTIEYHRSAKVLTEEQVAALTDWTAYAGAISETAQDAEQFVYYVRITDNAGNTICFASNGATFDLTKPVITGIADGADYYTTQSVQATDTNLASVTLNGKEVGTEFTIAGNTETEYVIVAADKAGNETTVTVTMHKTEALRENLGDITKDNATSADRETVQDYLDDLKERLEDEELTDEEKTILEGLVDEAQDILDRLDETEQAGSTEAVDQTQDITSDNVTPEDKEALEQAKEDIEQALDQFGGNYTDEEKAELEEELSRIEEALDVIERIEDTEAAIEALPDTVNPDDTEAEEQINAAKDLYDDLNDYEKSQISQEAKDKLEGLLAALRDYRITDGSGSAFTKGNTAGLTFTANGAYSKFTGIEVDGKAVDADCYTAENGSTIITLKAEYLETLAAGKHTLTVLYTDGKATGTFTVTEKPDEVVDDNGNTPQTGNDGDETGKDDAASSETGDDSKSPETGDDSNIALWIAVMLAAGAALTGTAVYSHKRKYSR